MMKLTELNLFGSARLGTFRADHTVFPVPSPGTSISTNYLGKKQYELSNHLGNVLAVVSDNPLGVDSDANGSVNYYEPVVTSAQEYYPFGMTMPSRTYQLAGASTYRFGFNGKEADKNNEWGLTQYDYGFRIYSPAVGRFLSVDPLQQKYTALSPYSFCANNPILFYDSDGRAILTPFKEIPFLIYEAGDRATMTLAQTPAWAENIKKWDTGGDFDKLGIDLNFRDLKKDEAQPSGSVDDNGKQITIQGMTTIKLMVGGKSISLDQYVGDGSDVERYIVDVGFFSKLDAPNILLTASHEVGSHGINYSDEIAAVKSGKTTFSEFQNKYKNIVAQAKADPINYTSPDHIQIGKGESKVYESMVKGIINTLKSSKGKLNKLESGYGVITIKSWENDGQGVDNRKGGYGPKESGSITRQPYTHEKLDGLHSSDKSRYESTPTPTGDNKD
jgi:RHS repeat-associated protein